jgi:PAS domain S-box-containing protein
LLSFWVWKNRKKENKRKDGLKSIAITLNKLQNQITTNERRYEERIKAFERNTNDAVYEYSYATGLFLHANTNFLQMFGYESLDEINGRLIIYENGERPLQLAKILVHEDHVEKIQSEMKLRLAGSTHEGKLENIWLLHKDGSPFPVNMKVTAIKENGSWITQGYITNIRESRSLTERIDALENVMAEMVGAWGKKRNLHEKIRSYTDFLIKRVKEAQKHE